MKLLYLSTDKQTYRTSSAIVLAALGSPGTHFFRDDTQTHKAKTNTSPAVAAGLYKSSRCLNFYSSYASLRLIFHTFRCEEIYFCSY